MSKLLLTLLFCCLVVAFTDALEENSKDLIPDKVENLLADKMFVKREAFSGAEKKKKKGGKKKPRRKNNKGKEKKKPRRKSSKGKGKSKPRRKNNKGKGKKNKTNARKGKKNRKNAKDTEGNGKKAKKANKSKKKGRKEKGRSKRKGVKSGKGKGGKAKERKGKKNGNKPGKGKLRKKKKGKKKGDQKKERKVKLKKKTRQQRGKKGSKPKPRQNGTDYKSCVDLFKEYSRIGIKLARTVGVQTKTIQRDQKTQGNKEGKKGDFSGTHGTLLSALGGNESALECDGTPITNGTRNAHYKSTLSTLKGCDANIGKMCNHTTNATFDALVESCVTAEKAFRDAFEICFKESDTDKACTCMTALDKMSTLGAITKCSDPAIKAGRDRISKEKDACKEGFKACKQAEDKSVEGVGTCKKVNRCGGAKNKTEATRLLKILKPLSAALANTGFADAMKKLGLDSGAGSDGKLPTSRLNQLRNARFADGREVRSDGDGRQTDGDGCKNVEAEWKVFNTSGDKAVPGVDSEPDAAETNKTIESLNKLNNGATLEADLGSCAKENSTRQVTVILTIVRIRFYVFWCGWFQVTVVEVQIIILEITFGATAPTPSPAPTPAPVPAPVPTSAPGGLSEASATLSVEESVATSKSGATSNSSTQRGTASQQVSTRVVPLRTFDFSTPAITASTAAECNCGKKKTSRIVGGTETEINEYPWMAAITYTSGFFFCGGTLITSEWVVTASHCMFRNTDGTNPLAEAEIRVVLGDHDKTSTTENTIPRIIRQVSQIITHPTYTASTSNNYIALLKLASAVDLGVYTPACLPKNGAKFVGQKAWVYGWGTTSFGGSTSDKLLEVEVPVVSNAVCITAMSNTITDAMLCAGGELNKDGCQGDSGGPLTVDVDGKHFLIGDVSFGNGCGLQGQYGVYGDVAYFRTSFIDANIGDAKNCP